MEDRKDASEGLATVRRHSHWDGDNPQPRSQNDETHLEFSRWWFVSSVFPMVAGTLSSVALAFSICSMGHSWVQQLPPDGDLSQAKFLPDPAWLTIVEAIQLSVAVVSNLFLLLDLTRKVRFTIAEPIAIVGWYVSCICLVCLHAVASRPLLDSLGVSMDQTVWSQSFYYGIWAAILYFIVASLIVVTFWGGAVYGHHEDDFDLSRSQRTLMLQTMVFLGFLLCGALVFSKVEDWNYLDAVYWADVTLFTIGFGDYAPTTVLGRALLFPFVLIGVISLGLVVSSIQSMILERGGRRLETRAQEKSRRRTLKSLARKETSGVLTPIEGMPTGEFDRRHSEFDLMRTIQKRALNQRRWVAMAISSVCFLCLWLCGALVFYRGERTYQGWNYFDAVYFCFVSLTTIGYGDMVPKSNAGKSFFVFWSLIALPILTILISNAGGTVVKFMNEVTIRLGSITLLPGRGGIKQNAKRLIHQLSCGRLYLGPGTEVARDLENGTTQAGQVSTVETSKSKGKSTNMNFNEKNRKDSMSKAAEPSHSYALHVTNPDSQHHPAHTRLNYLPTGDDLHLLIISEIQALSKHVQEEKPRRYTFEEWAWYLRLVGEDERNPLTHRKARPKDGMTHRKRGRKHRGSRTSSKQQTEIHDSHIELQQQQAADGEPLKWSWVGYENPLLGGQEESEWILEKLIDKLRELLLDSWRHRNEEAQPTM